MKVGVMDKGPVRLFAQSKNVKFALYSLELLQFF